MLEMLRASRALRANSNLRSMGRNIQVQDRWYENQNNRSSCLKCGVGYSIGGENQATVKGVVVTQCWSQKTQMKKETISTDHLVWGALFFGWLLGITTMLFLGYTPDNCYIPN